MSEEPTSCSSGTGSSSPRAIKGGRRGVFAQLPLAPATPAYLLREKKMYFTPDTAAICVEYAFNRILVRDNPVSR